MLIIKKQAFTLVELIVVITILVILGTISFLSFQGYAANSRDSVRVSDLNSTAKVLELFHLQTSYYPEPSSGENITFSGGVAWIQGTLGDSVISSLDKLSKVPVDPLTGNLYTYSRLNTNQEYQLGAIYEGNLVSYNNIDQSYAAGEKDASAYVIGNFNGETVSVNTGSVNYILATPSIINSDMTVKDIQDIINQKKLVYKHHKNLPPAYKGTRFNVAGGFDYANSDIVLFQGDFDDLYNDEGKRVEFVNKLKKAYGTGAMKTETSLQELLTVNLGSQKGREYIETKLENKIKKQKKFKRADVYPTSCGAEDGTFEGVSNGDLISDSCLYSYEGTADWQVVAGVGNGGGNGLVNLPLANGDSTSMKLNASISKPAKLNFDVKSNIQGASSIRFYINGVEYFKLGYVNYTQYGNYNDGYQTFTTPLLPAGDYEFKWEIKKGFNADHELFLDNINFSCIGGGVGCGIDGGLFEDGSIDPSDMFSFAGDIQTPWNRVTGAGANQGTYGFKNPDIVPSTGSAQMVYNKTLTQASKFNFDIKTDISGASGVVFYINDVAYLLLGYLDYTQLGNYNDGYRTFTTPLLPAGDYEFKWKIEKGFKADHGLFLDNMNFTCVGGGTGCGWSGLGAETGDIDPMDLFTFSGAVTTPWQRVTGAGNVVGADNTFAIQNPAPDYQATAYLEYNTTLAQDSNISFDLKTQLYNDSYFDLFINGGTELSLSPSTNYNDGFQSFTKLLPAGNYNIVWKVKRGYRREALIWLDNLQFTPQ